MVKKLFLLTFVFKIRKVSQLEQYETVYKIFLYGTLFISLFLNYWYSPTSIKIVSLNWLYFSNSRTVPVRRCAFGLFLIWRIVPKFLPCIVARRAPEIRNRQPTIWRLIVGARPWRISNRRLLTLSIAAKKLQILSGRVVLENSNNCAVRTNVFMSCSYFIFCL